MNSQIATYHPAAEKIIIFTFTAPLPAVEKLILLSLLRLCQHQKNL